MSIYNQTIDFSNAKLTRPSGLHPVLVDFIRTIEPLKNLIHKHAMSIDEFYDEYYRIFSVSPSILRSLAAGSNLPKKDRDIRYIEVDLPPMMVDSKQFGYTGYLPVNIQDKISNLVPIANVKLVSVTLADSTGKKSSSQKQYFVNNSPNPKYLGESIEIDVPSGYKLTVFNRSNYAVHNSPNVILDLSVLDKLSYVHPNNPISVQIRVAVVAISLGTAVDIHGNSRDLIGPVKEYVNSRFMPGYGWTGDRSTVTYSQDRHHDSTPPREDETSEPKEDDLFVTVNPYNVNGGTSSLSEDMGIIVVLNSRFRFIAHLVSRSNKKLYGSVKELLHSEHGTWFKEEVKRILKPYVEGEMSLVFGFPLEEIPPASNRWTPGIRL